MTLTGGPHLSVAWERGGSQWGGEANFCKGVPREREAGPREGGGARAAGRRREKDWAGPKEGGEGFCLLFFLFN